MSRSTSHSNSPKGALEIAEALGGAYRDGRDWRCRCPVHLGRSLTLRDGHDTLLIRCWAGCETKDVLAELRRLGLIENRPAQSGQHASDALTGLSRDTRLRTSSHSQSDLQTDTAENNRRKALEIWRQSVDPRGTPVEAYLKSRGLQPPSAGADVLRFNSLCPFGSGYSPAMIGLVRNIETNEPQAIHRTAISYRGNKQKIGDVSKMSLGPIAGGAIKLSGDATTAALGIAEGIETALSLQILKGLPVWSLICAAGIAHFPLLNDIETLAVAVDHDAAGERAAIAVAERWHDRQVVLIEPRRVGADLNDEILKRAPA